MSQSAGREGREAEAEMEVRFMTQMTRSPVVWFWKTIPGWPSRFLRY
jgi:hypothetical protein